MNRRDLILGGATLAAASPILAPTARAAAQDPALRVEAVELLPEVVEAAARFAPKRTPGGADGDAGAFPLRPIVADARRFVQAGGPQYDVIVADLEKDEEISLHELRGVIAEWHKQQQREWAERNNGQLWLLE